MAGLSSSVFSAASKDIFSEADSFPVVLSQACNLRRLPYYFVG